MLAYNSATMTQLISTIAIAMGASWVSGINLYAAVATLGCVDRDLSISVIKPHAAPGTHTAF